MSSRQFGEETYIGKLQNKLDEADLDRSSLERRMTETESILKGTKATLEETRDQLETERVGFTGLQKALDDLKASMEVEKEKAVEAALMDFKQFEAFNDITSEF